MQLKIIEDCSPFFIRFTYKESERVFDICRREKYLDKPSKFIHHAYPTDIAREILSSVPKAEELRLNLNRVSLFITKPHHDYRAHKDGVDMKFSLNFHVKVEDNLCKTSWYSDDDLKHYPINPLGMNSRECHKFDKTKHTPLKSMVAQQGEVTLFNVDIFHGFDNSLSDNERWVLTLRDVGNPRITFDEAKSILFS